MKIKLDDREAEKSTTDFQPEVVVDRWLEAPMGPKVGTWCFSRYWCD